MMDYPVNKMPETLSCVEESQRQRLTRLKQNLEERIKDINLALQLLDKNPEIEQLTDLLRRI